MAARCAAVGWGHCATSRKVPESIPVVVNGIFHSHTPSGGNVALGLTQPLTNEYHEYFLGGKGDRRLGLTLPPSGAYCLEIWKPQPPGTLRACPGL